MRRLGAVSDPLLAAQFLEHLQRQGMSGVILQAPEGFGLWVDDEDLVPRAREEFVQFLEAPSAPRFRRPEELTAAAKQAALPSPPEKRPRRRRRRWWLGLQAPVTWLVILLALSATLATGFGQRMTPIGEWLLIEPVTNDGSTLMRWSASRDPLVDVRQGEVWRLWTPVLMHFHILHLLFNLHWTYLFGSAIEIVRGSFRLLLLVLITGTAGNLAQYFWTGPMFGGLSGVGHGMFGYLWMYTLFRPDGELYLPRTAYWGFWFWFALCFTGIVGPIANLAHAAGLLSGIACGLLMATFSRD